MTGAVARTPSREATASPKVTYATGPVIHSEGLSKCYQIYDRPRDRLKQALVPRLLWLAGRQVPQYFREFWALLDVSFQVQRGEAVGIIGRNGAGKSTLLQIIAGTLTPTRGSIEVNGKVAALLELGSGFNPEFTGRENVWLNASILGLSNDEIAAKYEQIKAFADIGDFVDQPVKTYSSGMMLRLAFAVQTAVHPDIFIIDEALAVGDAVFQSKCFRRLDELRAHGVTCLFVSHDLNSVLRFCDRAIMLEEGHIIRDGDAREVTVFFQRFLFGADEQVAKRNEVPRAPLAETRAVSDLVRNGDDVLSLARSLDSEETGVSNTRYGTGEAVFVSVGVIDPNGREARTLMALRDYVFCCELEARSSLRNITIGLRIRTPKGFDVFAANTAQHGITFPEIRAGQRVKVRFSIKANLGPGEYLPTFGVRSLDSEVFYDRVFDPFVFTVLCDCTTDPVCLANLDEKVQASLLDAS